MPRITATAAAAMNAPPNAPMRTPRNAPARRMPSAAALSPLTLAATRETAISAAPASTNCQLPPGRIAVLPTIGWRRLPQTTRTMPKTQILIGAGAGRRGWRLAGDQERGLDVVTRKVDFPVHDAPVERLRRGSLRELGLVGQREVAPGVRPGLIARVDARLGRRDDNAELPVDGPQDLGELGLGRRVLEEIVGSAVD